VAVLTGKGDGVGPADPDVAAFAGPGEMRALFRSTDWSATSLGPVASWSPILRLMVEVCLDSGFPVLINWGPELVALYNDAFAPMMRKAPDRIRRVGQTDLAGVAGLLRRQARASAARSDGARRRRATNP